MLIKFKSKATQDLMMMDDLAKHLFKLIDMELGERGVISVAEIPAAITKLEAAMAADKVQHDHHHTQVVHHLNNNDENKPQEAPLHLGQRAYPLLDTLRQAYVGQADILWEKRQCAETTLRLKGKDIFVEAQHEDLYAAIDAMIDKLDRQVIKYKDKVQDHSRDALKYQETQQIDDDIALDISVTNNLFARESIGSTGLGAGVTIPHGSIKGLKHPLAAFIRLTEPIPFESPDGIALLSKRDIRQQLLSEQRPEGLWNSLVHRTFDEEFVKEATSAADLVGHLNFIHPNRIQILGSPKVRYYQHLPEENRKMGEMIALLPPCLMVCDGASPPADLEVTDTMHETVINSGTKKLKQFDLWNSD
ncbi:hypothetical protein ACTFIZ_002359 [Dictyostelium cf. discoideum]